MAAAGIPEGHLAAAGRGGLAAELPKIPVAARDFFGMLPAVAQVDVARSGDAQTAPSTSKVDQVPASLEQVVSGAPSRPLMPCSDLPDDRFEGFLAHALGELQRSVLSEHERVVKAMLQGGSGPEPTFHEAPAALGPEAVGDQASPRSCGSSIEQVVSDSRRSSETALMTRTASLNIRTAPKSREALQNADGSNSAPIKAETWESLATFLKVDSRGRCPREVSQERLRKRRDERHGSARAFMDRLESQSHESMLGTRRKKPSEGDPKMHHVPSDGHNGDFALLDIWQSAVDVMSKQGSAWRRSAMARAVSDGSAYTASTQPESKFPEAKDAGRSPWRNLRWWLMSPTCKRRLVWDALSMLCILYDMVMAPLEFLNESCLHPSARSPLAWMILLFWTLDILASCASGYTRPNGTEVYELRLIWKRYASSWLLPDAAMVGADWTEALVHNDLPTGWRLLRMMRLLRLLRLKRFLSLLVMRMQSERAALVFGSAQVLLGILFLAHGMGCLWAGLGMSEGAQGWVYHAAGGDELTSGQTYLLAVHWALTNFAGTVNLGPRSWRERIYAIFSLVFGFLVASAFVSIITSNMTRLSILASRRAGEFKDLNTYLHERGISRSLKSRVLLNAQHAIAEQEAHIPEESVKLLEDVSEHLRRELHFEIYADHLSVHPLFGLLRSRSLPIMKRICHEAVVPVLVSENEVIFSLEEVPSEPPHVIFLEKGLLTYQLGGGAIQDVHPGQWISEQVLWTDWVYQGTLCSVTPSRLLMLNSMVFQNVLSTKAPQGTLSAEVAKYATEFLKQLNSSKYGDRSDLGSHDACARLAAQCSGTDLQDSTPDAPERRMSGSLGMNAVQESMRELHSWLGTARRPEQGAEPGFRPDAEPPRSSASLVRAWLPWGRRQNAPVAPASPAARGEAPALAP